MAIEAQEHRIVQPLTALRRRVRGLAVMAGVCWLVACGVTLLLAVAAVDYLFHLPPLARGVLGAGLVGLVLVGGWKRVLAPLVRPVPLDALAARLDALNAGTQDHVRSALRFTTQEDGDSSRRMQQMVIGEAAEALAGEELLESAVDRRPLWRWGKRAGLAVVFVAALAAWQPASSRLAALRLLQPAAGYEWPRRVEVELLSPMPQRVPLGHRIEVVARINRGESSARSVVLNWRIGNESVQRQLMQRDSSGRYLAAIDARPARSSGADEARLTAWIEAGDHELDLAPVTLVRRLAVVNAVVHVEPPAYTGAASEELPLRSRQVTVWAGSKLRLALGFNKPLAADAPVALEAVGEGSKAPVAGKWQRVSPGEVRAELDASSSVRFRVRARDEDGYENQGSEEYSIVVRPDQPPVITLEKPRRSEERTAVAMVPVVGAAEDDVGVREVSLRARLVSSPAATQATEAGTMVLVQAGRVAAPGAEWSVGTASAERRRDRVALQWKLAQFPATALKPGDVVEYWLEAGDALAGREASHMAGSQKLRITIVSEQELIERVGNDLRALAGRVSETRKAQERLAADAKQLAADVAGKRELTAADEQVLSRVAEAQLRLSSQASELSSRLGEVQQQLDENQVQKTPLRAAAEEAARKLTEAAQQSMPRATRELKEAGRRDGRQSKLEQAVEAQKQAVESLKQAESRLGDFGGLGQMLERVRDLLDEQRQATAAATEAGKGIVGKPVEQLSPEQRKQLEAAAGKQEDAAKRTQEVLDALKAASEKMQKSDAAAAAAMAEAAATGQSQSVSQHQQAAASAVGQNQQSQASASQKSAELGLEMMLAGLRDAERRKLEELVQKLAELREQVQVLRQRQASHNLDNLVLREPEKTRREATTRPVLDLLEKAARHADSLKEASLRQLSASQQQTHLNALDLAVGTANVSSTEAVAELLSRAAGRMERALVHLRAENVVEAYDPPQVEALARLDDALAEVEAMQRKSEQQARQQQQEAVRAILQAIQEEQLAVAGETQRLAKALVAEAKRRADQLKLAQSASQQEELSRRMEQVESELQKLGSVVFESVAREARLEMAEAAGAMKKGEAGVGVQRRHVRILARLEAMIRALKEEPPKPERFAERSQGGGAGGGAGKSGRRLPPGAEMKLLRELQQVINSDTKAADAAKPPAESLDDLAQRQQAVRAMLDAMLKRASEGKLGLPAEKPGALVPEENEEFDDELDAELLTGKDAAAGDPEPVLEALSQRLTRSRERLGEGHDAGKTTQRIQEKIVRLLDDLAKKSQQQEQQQSGGASSGSGESSGRPRPGGGAPQGAGQNGKSEAGGDGAGESKLAPGETPPEPAGGDIRQSAREWGGLSDRDRQAVIDSAGEDVVEKYRALVEDYYRALSEKATSERR